MKPGDRLASLERTLGLEVLVGYAAATWDWYGTHYDPAAIAAAGLPGALVDGQMLGALMAEQALDAMRPGAVVRRMSFRFRSMVFAGDSVTVEGIVEAVDGDLIRIDQRVLAGGRVAVAPAWTEVRL